MSFRCIPMLTVLVAAAFVPPAGGLFAQTVQLHNPVVDALQFPGGTVKEFVDVVGRLDDGLNIVLRPGVKDLSMPPVDLKRVSRDDIVELICALASNESAEARVERQIIGSQPGAAASRVYVLTLIRKAMEADRLPPANRLLHEAGYLPRASAAQRSVQVYSLKGAAQVVRIYSPAGGLQPGTGGPGDAGRGVGGGGLLGGAPGGLPGIGGVAAMEEKSRDYNTVLTAIETALRFRGEQGDEQAEIKFHAESGLLFVRAVPDQHALIQEVIDQLDGSFVRRDKAKENELSEAMRDLRDAIRALHGVGQAQSTMLGGMQGGMDNGDMFRSNSLNQYSRALNEAKRDPLERKGKAKVPPNVPGKRLDPDAVESKPQAPQAK